METVLEFKLINPVPPRVFGFPQIRFMGSKYRLLPWIYRILCQLDFSTALDPFSGSGCVSYLLKSMGKQVTASDFLNFSSIIAKALIENPGIVILPEDIEFLLTEDLSHPKFIERKFNGIFFEPGDLRFLDRVRWNIEKMGNRYKRALATSALIRSCVKRQPRGVFTVAGDPAKYKDGRRDLKLSLRQHFEEQVWEYNQAVFDNGKKNHATKSNVFDMEPTNYDLVYMDPPYVPRSDDNCYIKRYHFLEGLSCYWEGFEIIESSKVKKIKKLFTPFSYRKTAISAFDRMFARFSKSILVLSYSSNGYPDLPILVEIMKRYKDKVDIFEQDHRYHFGTHKSVRRNQVKEFLIVGT